jgi:hypothetical protein
MAESKTAVTIRANFQINSHLGPTFKSIRTCRSDGDPAALRLFYPNETKSSGAAVPAVKTNHSAAGHILDRRRNTRSLRAIVRMGRLYVALRAILYRTYFGPE